MNNVGHSDNYKDAFDKLGQNNVLISELAGKLSQWAGLRDILAHVYEKVDFVRFLKIIKRDLDDFEIFIQEIAELKKNSSYKCLNC